MMKYKKKIICTILLIITIFMISSNVQAATCPACKGNGLQPGSSSVTCPACHGTGESKTTSHTASGIIDEGESFITIGEQGANDKLPSSDLKNLSDTLYIMLLTVGIVIAVIVGLVLGIKFIMGSIEDKAEIKTMVVPYVIGCIVVFGAFTIWKIVVNILQSM